MKTLVELALEGKKARSRRSKWERFWALVIFRLALAPFDGWLLMLGVGVVHAEWIPALPTIGYYWAVVVTLIVQSIWPPRFTAAAKS